MATTFIRVTQTGGAPEDYLVSGATDIDMLSCSAHFNGATAAVDFYPAIQVLDEAGQVAATVIGPKVTAGGTSDVTFAPFLEQPATGGGGGSGIQFDTFPQAGGWLYAETDNAAGSPRGFGTDLIDASTGGMSLESSGGRVTVKSPAKVDLAVIKPSVLSSGGASIHLENVGGGVSPLAEIFAVGTVAAATDSMVFIDAETHAAHTAQVLVRALNATSGDDCETDWTTVNAFPAEWTGPVVVTTIPPGGSAYWRNSLFGPLFRIDADGSIHGQAAIGAITWDL